MKIISIDTGLRNIGVWVYDTKNPSIDFGFLIETSPSDPLDVRLSNILDKVLPLLKTADFVIFEHFQPRTSGIKKVGATIEVNGFLSGVLQVLGKRYTRQYPHVWKPKRKNNLDIKMKKHVHIKDAKEMLHVWLDKNIKR